MLITVNSQGFQTPVGNGQTIDDTLGFGQEKLNANACAYDTYAYSQDSSIERFCGNNALCEGTGEDTTCDCTEGYHVSGNATQQSYNVIDKGGKFSWVYPNGQTEDDDTDFGTILWADLRCVKPTVVDQCVANTCFPANVLNSDYSQISITGTTGSTTTVTCDTGYAVAEDETIVAECGTDGLFNTITCIAEDCAATKVVNSDKASIGAITGSTGSTTIVTCDTGYAVAEGEPIVAKCGTDGLFNTITCEPKDCAATKVANSNKASTDAITGFTGQTVIVTCNNDWIVNDDSSQHVTAEQTLTCEATGYFSLAKPCINTRFDTALIPTSTSDCHFMSLDDIFTYNFTAKSVLENPADYETTWMDAQYLGESVISFDLQNYEATTKDNAYKLFSVAGFAQTPEEDTRITQRKKEFKTVCYYKPKIAQNIATNEYEVDSTLLSNALAGCTIVQDVGGQQIIDQLNAKKNTEEFGDYNGIYQYEHTTYVEQDMSVASKCGNTNVGIEDAFAWATLTATLTQTIVLKYKITFDTATNEGYSNDFEVTIEGFTEDTSVAATDMLFVSGTFATTKQSIDSVGEMVVEFNDQDFIETPSKDGKVAIVSGNLAVACSSKMTVKSDDVDYAEATENSGNQHCYFTDSSLIDGCQVKLDVTCTQQSEDIVIEDDRQCWDNSNGDILSCGTIGHTPIGINRVHHQITAKSIIIEAIRLNTEHKYPSLDEEDFEDIVLFEYDGSSENGDEGEFHCFKNCVNSDPFLKLGSSADDDVYLKLDCTMVSTEPTFDSGSDTTTLKKGCQDTEHKTVCAEPTTVTQTCISTDHNNGVAGSINWTKVAKTSKIYSQFYLYGLSTFTKTGTQLQQTISPDQYVKSRRLGGTGNDIVIETKTLFITMPQSKPISIY